MHTGNGTFAGLLSGRRQLAARLIDPVYDEVPRILIGRDNP